MEKFYCQDCCQETASERTQPVHEPENPHVHVQNRCGRRDSNPHEGCPSAVFKTAASAIPPRPRWQDPRARAYRVSRPEGTKTPGHGPGGTGAEDGIRTRDLLLGKEMLYH